jgi:hypothetical protein
VIYDGYPVDASYVISEPRHWVLAGTGVRAGDSFPHLVGVEYDRVNPAYPTPHNIDVFAHSPVDCSGRWSFSDSAYYSTPPDLPSLITLPTISGTVDENNFGEFGIRLFIYQHLRNQDQSIRVSNGADGDRYVLVKTPKGNAIVWASMWDTPADAAEFMSAIDQVMVKRFFVRPRVTDELRHFETDTRTVQVNVREVDGRPLVLYVDTPAGIDPESLINFAKVRVTPR